MARNSLLKKEYRFVKMHKNNFHYACFFLLLDFIDKLRLLQKQQSLYARPYRSLMRRK